MDHNNTTHMAMLIHNPDGWAKCLQDNYVHSDPTVISHDKSIHALVYACAITLRQFAWGDPNI